MVIALEKQSAAIEKTKKKIAEDLVLKEQALCIEEACAKITSGVQSKVECGRRKKKKR